MTNQQLSERITKLESIHPAEVGCRAGELANILRDYLKTKQALWVIDSNMKGDGYYERTCQNVARSVLD